ncbi:tail fiber domain-containing protein [Candidatus Nomurabacteria bacterium]|nr:tail fiber domain-containing protein [Candidatus Nomurabacteria bacterium]
MNRFSKRIPVAYHGVLLLVVFFGITTLTGARLVRAQTAETLNFQGKIVRNDSGNVGINVSSSETTCISGGADSCDFKVVYYDASTGGNTLGTEQFSNIEIGAYDGVFNLPLGAGDTWTAGTETTFLDIFINNSTVYAQVHFDKEGDAYPGGAYSDAFGRMAVRAAPFAIRANSADNINGFGEDNFVQFAPSGVQTDTSTSSSIFINKTGGSGNILQLQKSAADVFVIDNSGNVGINTTTPESLLDVYAGVVGDIFEPAITLRAEDALAGGNPELRLGFDYDYLTGGFNAITFESYEPLAGGEGHFIFRSSGTLSPYRVEIRNGSLMTTEDLMIGGDTPLTSMFSVDQSAGIIYLGADQSANPILRFEATDNDTADFGFNTNDSFYFTGGNLGIGDTSPASALTVGNGDLFQVNSSGQIAAAAGITSSGTITFSGLSNGVVTVSSGVLSGGTIGASFITADSLDFTEFKDSLALDASTDIAVDGTEVFSITNTGTGNSFQVNDAGSDTTPFIIDASGNVGIGVTSASYPLDVNKSFSAGSGNTQAVYIYANRGLLSDLETGNHIGVFVDTRLDDQTVSSRRLNANTRGISSSISFQNSATNYGSAIVFHATTVNYNSSGTPNGRLSFFEAEIGAGAARYGDVYGLRINSLSGISGTAYGVYVTDGKSYFGGQVGVGTSSPSSTSMLHVSGADSNLIGLIAGSTKGVRIGADSTGGRIGGVDQTGAASDQPLTITGTYISFGLPSEAMRLASGGNLGIGDTSPASALTVGNGDLFQVNSSGQIAAAAGITSSGTITFSGLFADRLVATTTGGQLTNTLSSANLALSISDETGSGLLVFGTSPTFTTSITTPQVTYAGGTLSIQTTDSNAISLNSGSDTIVLGTSNTSGDDLLIPDRISDWDNGAYYLDPSSTSVLVNLTVTTSENKTSATTPLLLGGSLAASNLIIQSTSGNGSGDFISLRVGNNGATEAIRVVSSGAIAIGQSSVTSGRQIDTSSGGYLTSAGVWTSTSSRALKENYTLLDYDQILNNISELSVEKWSYKVDDSKYYHIGPYAEDFYQLFSVGQDNRSIAAMDTSGVALAGIKGLVNRVADLKIMINGIKNADRSLRSTDPNSAKILGENTSRISEIDLRIDALEASIAILGVGTGSPQQYWSMTNTGIKADTEIETEGVYSGFGVFGDLSSDTLSVANGLFRISTAGNVAVSGDMLISGVLYGDGGLLQIDGDLQLDRLIAKQILIDTSDQGARTAGSGELTASTTEVTIDTISVEEGSKILVTPTSDTGGQVLYVKDKVVGKGFTVSVGSPIPNGVTFDWWILNTYDDAK